MYLNLSEIKENSIILGDMHLGVKNFNQQFLTNQLSVFKEQIFPYMKENEINVIFQLGDIFDNRTTTNINFINQIRVNFFDKLVENNIIIYILLGNHDIYFRESRKVSLIEHIAELYPNNVELVKDRKYMTFNNEKLYIVPWITKSEELNKNELKDIKYILGHFEIKDFQMVKGIRDTNSILNKDFFSNKIVFSGHYHLKDTKTNINYLGTPYQLTWSDFGEKKGFYHWKKDASIEFIENITSTKHIKMFLDGTNLTIKGLTLVDKIIKVYNFNKILPLLEKHITRIYLVAGDEISIITNLISNLDINISIIDNREDDDIFYDLNLNNYDPKELILESVKEHNTDALLLLLDILEEI